MPLCVGIALVSLNTGSDIFIEVVSSDDQDHPHSFQDIVIDTSDLTSTFKRIGEKIEGLAPNTFISLTVPTYVTEEELKAISITAKSISPFCKGRLPTSTNIALLLESEEELRREYEGQYELILEIGPDYRSYSRLIATYVEENFRQQNRRMEITTRVDAGTASAALVDPVLAALPDPPLITHFSNHDLIEVKDPSLKRVLILDSSPDHVSSEVIASLKSKFPADEMRPCPEIILRTNPGPLLAHYAVRRSLNSYLSAIDPEAKECLVFNVSPLRLGIVNADGSITTALKQYQGFPTTHSLVFTTARDGQTNAIVTVVAGLAPRADSKDGNIVITQLFLKGLKPRAKGVHRIHVTIDVEQLGRTRIVAQEDTMLELDSDQELEAKGGASASVELKNMYGEVDLEELENICDTYRDLAYDTAEDPAVRWAGTSFDGDLPE